MSSKDKNVDLIQASCIAFAVLFALNLLFTIHNIVRYILGLKMKQKLIVIFYVMISLASFFRIIEFILRAALPDNFWPTEDKKIEYA